MTPGKQLALTSGRTHTLSVTFKVVPIVVETVVDMDNFAWATVSVCSM
jgi:hypothetical protein